MSNNGFVKVNGAQKQIISGYTKVNGVWKKISDVFDKVNGTWKQSWKDAFPMPSFLSYPSAITRGQTITWTTESVTGAVYEYQVSYNGGAWGTSVFTTPPTGTLIMPTDTSINTFQMRIRSVDPTTHESASTWMTGPSRSLSPQQLVPVGVSYTATIARGDKVRIYWNVTDTSLTYELHVWYNTALANSKTDTIIFSNKVTSTGQNYFDYTVTTDTKWVNVQFVMIVKKTGYFDSGTDGGPIVTLGGQKLGTITTMNVPSIQQDVTITISWGAVTNAIQYMLEVAYDNSSTYTRVYWGTSRSTSYTAPANHTHVQFRVKATAPNYTDGNYHYAWSSPVTIAPPPLKSMTWVTTGTHEWRPQFGGQWDSNAPYTLMMQGEWTDNTGTWGNYKSIALFNYQDIRNKLSGRTIVTTKVYFYRISTPHGYYTGQPLELYTHNYASRPASGEPSMLYADGPIGSYALGQGYWLQVSNVIAERIRDGQAMGFGLYSPTGSYYGRFSQNVQLYVEYR